MVVAIYFLIGLFIAGIVAAFEDDPGTFVLIVFLWPILVGLLVVFAVVAIPVVVGIWIGNRIKGWF